MARQRNKSRISPTFGGLIYVVVAGLILEVAIYTQSNLLFWFFGLMVGALLVSLLIAARALRKLEAHRLLPGHGVADENLAIRYELINHSRLPVFGVVIREAWGSTEQSAWQRMFTRFQDWLIASLSDAPMPTRNPDLPRKLRARPHACVLHLGPRQSIQGEAICLPVQRGRLRFERIVVSTAFPFGFVRKTVRLDQPQELLIYPKLHRVQRKLLFSVAEYEAAGHAQVEAGGGMEEFFGLRPYRDGDSLKLIDWRHSARTGELISREMTQPAPSRVTVLLDLSEMDEATQSDAQNANNRQIKDQGLTPREAAIERAISLAASVVWEAQLNGYQVGLAVRGCRFEPLRPNNGMTHHMRMLESLAALDVTDTTESAPVPFTPSVIVTAGAGGAAPAPDHRVGTVTFGAAEMETYIAA